MFDIISNLGKVVNLLNDLFYGEYWYISWGIIFLMFAVIIGFEFPKLMKSFKENKERKNKTKVDIWKK